MRDENGQAAFILAAAVPILIVLALLAAAISNGVARTKYTTICTVIQTGVNSYEAVTADSGNCHFDRSNLSDTQKAQLYRKLQAQTPGTFSITYYHNVPWGGNALYAVSRLSAKQQHRDLCTH